MYILLLIVSLIAADPTKILWSVSVSQDGTTIATSGTPSPWLREAVSLHATHDDHFFPSGQATAVAFHPNGTMLGVTGETSLTRIADLRSRTFSVIPTEEGARGVDFNHDGSLIALSENSGAMSVWSVETRELLYRDHPVNGKSLTGIAWHPSENVVVSIGEFITIYDLSGKSVTRGDGIEQKTSDRQRITPVRLNHRHDARGYCLLLGVEWHPSGDFFTISEYGNPATGAPPSNQIRSREGKLIKTIERPGSEIRNVRWNPAGDRLAATSDALMIYGENGKMLSETEADSDLWGLTWSPNGRVIFTTDLLGTLARWEPTNGQQSRFEMRRSTR